MKISAIFPGGDMAECAVHEMKKAGVGISVKDIKPLGDSYYSSEVFADNLFYPPSGMDIMGMGNNLTPYEFPQSAAPMGIWGDEPNVPYSSGKTRLELECDENEKNQVKSILIANNASDIHFHQ